MKGGPLWITGSRRVEVVKEGCWLKLNLGQDPHQRRDSWTPNELSWRCSGRVLEAQDQVSAGPSFKDPAQTSRRPG